jgi:protein-tyrosine phosphatase
MGNICRSPTAEGVFRKLITEAGMASQIHVASAGTHAYHIGDPPDPRSQEAALRRGIDLSALRGRHVTDQHIKEYDYVLAMDSDNYEGLMDICPEGYEEKVRLFLEFAPHRPEREVPDPYYGGVAGFDRVLDMIEEAAQGLLEDIRKNLK